MYHYRCKEGTPNNWTSHNYSWRGYSWDTSRLNKDVALLSWFIESIRLKEIGRWFDDSTILLDRMKNGSAERINFNHIHFPKLVGDMSSVSEEYLNMQTKQSIANMQLHGTSGLHLRWQEHPRYSAAKDNSLSLSIVWLRALWHQMLLWVWKQLCSLGWVNMYCNIRLEW